MLFSGKRYRRVYCENVEEVMSVTIQNCTNNNEMPGSKYQLSDKFSEDYTSPEIIQMLKARAPIFSFTRIDEQTFEFALQVDNVINTRIFRLGEEQQLERRNGTKVGITYTLEDQNVLNQIVRLPDGRVAHFRREFADGFARMVINIQGAHCQGYIYYEEVY